MHDTVKQDYLAQAERHLAIVQALLDKVAELLQKEGRTEPVERFNWNAPRHFPVCWIDAGLTPKTVQRLTWTALPITSGGAALAAGTLSHRTISSRNLLK